MSKKRISYDFPTEAATAIISGQTNSLTLTGNIRDLFYLQKTNKEGDFIPLVDYIAEKWNVPKRILILYDAAGRIRILGKNVG